MANGEGPTSLRYYVLPVRGNPPPTENAVVVDTHQRVARGRNRGRHVVVAGPMRCCEAYRDADQRNTAWLEEEANKKK